MHRRIKREEKTLRLMISSYCRKHHHSGDTLCEECELLFDYGQKRLVFCPFGHKKGTCAKCPIHCYQVEMREKMRNIMRYAGPRMIFQHPFLALCHLADGIRKFPNEIQPYPEAETSEPTH